MPLGLKSEGRMFGKAWFGSVSSQDTLPGPWLPPDCTIADIQPQGPALPAPHEVGL